MHAHLHPETHLVARIGWLRAAVLGANDGIVSTASLIVGVAAASASTSEVLVAGVAGLVAGAMSMAAGEYVRGDGGATAADLDRAVYRGSIAHLRNRHAEKLCRPRKPVVDSRIHVGGSSDNRDGCQLFQTIHASRMSQPLSCHAKWIFWTRSS